MASYETLSNLYFPEDCLMSMMYAVTYHTQVHTHTQHHIAHFFDHHKPTFKTCVSLKITHI